MVAAADAVAAAVSLHTFIINRPKTRQAAQEVAGKPRERLRAANGAHPDFEVVTAPAPLERPPRPREARPQERRPFGPAPHLLPERAEHGFHRPLAQHRQRLVREVLEQLRIGDGPLLIRHLAGPAVERHHGGVRPGVPLGGRVRQAQGGGLHGVVIDDQVQRRELVPAGQAVQRKVLDPDAGVKQFRLMAGEDERRVAHVRDGFTEGLHGGASGGDGGLPGSTPQVVPRPAKYVGAGAPEPTTIGFEQSSDRGQGRLGQDGPVFGRGAQRGADAHRQLPLGRKWVQQHGAGAAASAASRSVSAAAMTP